MAMTDRKIVFECGDMLVQEMLEDMQQDAVNCAKQALTHALEKYSIDDERAAILE